MGWLSAPETFLAVIVTSVLMMQLANSLIVVMEKREEELWLEVATSDMRFIHLSKHRTYYVEDDKWRFIHICITNIWSPCTHTYIRCMCIRMCVSYITSLLYCLCIQPMIMNEIMRSFLKKPKLFTNIDSITL